MFQPASDQTIGRQEATPFTQAPPPTGVAGASSSPFTQAASPLNAANGSPFSPGTPLFKVAPGESLQAQPLQSSPFSTFASSQNSCLLTVADVLPQLPPEVARFGGLASDQPVAVSSQMLDTALRSGQAALPIFEIYRVCPALFLTPISPQDPRMIPLPAAKLPRLIASIAQQGTENNDHNAAANSSEAAPANPPPFQASPFSTATPPSPFIQVEPEPPLATPLPPRRNGPPPPLADIPGRDTSQLSLPGAPGANASPSAFPMSPFAASNLIQEAVTEPAEPSPFGSQPANPLPAAPNLFAVKPEDTGAKNSPFGVAATPAAQAPPFETAAPADSPAPSTRRDVPFAKPAAISEPQAHAESPFRAAASPLQASGAGPLFAMGGGPGEPPRTHFSSSQNSPQSLFGNGQPTPGGFSLPITPPANTSGSTFRVSLSGLLRGYTVAELGFDPAIVPTWIMTTLPVASMRDQLASGTVVAELGSLIDGITDVGFRNVLNNAKHEFQLRLPTAELSHALSAGSPVASPSPPAPVTSQTMRIEPPSQNAATFPAPEPMPVPVPAPQAQAAPPSPFGAPAQISPHSLFGAPSQPASTPGPGPSLGPLSPVPLLPSFGASSPAPLQPPFGAPPSSLQSLFGAPSPQPQQPAFGAPQSPPASAPTPSLFGPVAKPQDPFSAPAAENTPAQQPNHLSTAPTPSWPQAKPLAAQEEQSFTQPPPQPPVSERPQAPAQLTPRPPIEGFSSAQLLGGNNSPAPAFGGFSERPAAPSEPPSFRPAPPANFYSAEPQRQQEPPAPPPPQATFAAPVFEERRPAPEPAPPPPRPAAPPMPPSAKPHVTSVLGLQPLDTKSDQMLLRALLGTDEDLTPQRVVEMTSALGGIAACVCLKGDRVLSHAGAHKPQAREFQKQATDLAHHLRSLGPLIGIADAETFTLNAGERLMTFCFPENTILGVLHDDEPSVGLRDKITLIARELSRMLA